jgi:hypothetical protein
MVRNTIPPPSKPKPWQAMENMTLDEVREFELYNKIIRDIGMDTAGRWMCEELMRLNPNVGWKKQLSHIEWSEDKWAARSKRISILRGWFGRNK